MRNTVLVTLREDARRLPVERQPIERATRTEHITVPSGVHRTEDEEVDDMRKDGDAHADHGNNVGRRSSARLGIAESGEKVRVVVVDDDTDAKGAEDEEERQSPEDAAEGDGHVLPGRHRLSSSHGYVVRSYQDTSQPTTYERNEAKGRRTSDGESRLDKAGHEPSHPTRVARVEVLREGCSG